MILDPAERITSEEILEHPWFQDTKEFIEDVFTETEKERIKREFSYKDTSNLNWNTNWQHFELGELKRDDECFSEHGLESSNDSLLKNNSTKSLVLAPFNSTFGSFETFGTEIWSNMFYKGDMIWLGHWVREIDWQYEYNNNCELDNGVYNKFMVENMHKQKDSEEDGP